MPLPRLSAAAPEPPQLRRVPFLAARARFMHRGVGRDIAIALALKFLLLWALHTAFFSHPQEASVAVRANEVARVMLSAPDNPMETRHDR